MKKKYLVLIALSFLAMTLAFNVKEEKKENKNIADYLFDLGEEKPEHWLAYDSMDVKRGYELIHIGRTTSPKGRKSKPISRFYECTSCHNVKREDPDLTLIDPEARLNYAIETQLPYLQGSTFWGIVNRESWYNDDYVLKYGDLVTKASKSLKESIQLCAQVCAQGRKLEDWEVNSILAYYWSLQISFDDLDLKEGEQNQLKELKDEGKNQEAIQLLKSKYLATSPATFSKPPKDKKEGYAYEGRPEMGKAIYELSCQHCHHVDGESDVVLDNSKLTFRWLKKNIPSQSKLSLYEIIRIGTYSEAGHKEYMPHYTLEKMSDQQVEDLRAYVELSSQK